MHATHPHHTEVPSGNEHEDSPAWVHGHPHEPNPAPPSLATSFIVTLASGAKQTYDVVDLQRLPRIEIPNCFIVSTGHGTSGPFTFTGVRLVDFLAHAIPTTIRWQQIDVISGDGFGTRLSYSELQTDPADRPSLLAYQLDHEPLTREQGLIRLIVPAETDDALKQVKWVAGIVVDG